MKTLSVCVYVLVLAASATGDYKKVGDSLTLTPDISSFPEKVKGILWRHAGNKAAELDRDFSPDVDYYGDFIGRTTLDTQTGRLDITDLRTSDTGVFSLYLNSKPQRITSDIKVIKEVPDPQITVKCETPRTSCTLTCEGDTTGAEPVTYSWRGGEKELGTTDRTLTVTEADQHVKTFTCQIKNPVSERSSSPHKNPLFPDNIYIYIAVGVSAGLAGVAAAVGWFICRPRYKSGGWSFMKVPGGSSEANKENGGREPAGRNDNSLVEVETNDKAAE